ncbi:MAG TPA: hypothetical protein VNG90_01280 [Candidatus Acidoferrum sp.]|nr:hypothetical protein [Candidatus Acidoferrum sp.]
MGHKYWFKLARSLQKDRASTVDSEKILRLTKSITHMHRMQFVARRPEQAPSAHVYFMTPDELSNCLLPVNTFSVYVATAASQQHLHQAIKQLPQDAVIADYTSAGMDLAEQLQPKHMLETSACSQWEVITSFLRQHNIHIETLINRGSAENSQAIDDALDTLLGIGHSFLLVAGTFQHAYELAQPFRFADHQKQRQFETLMLLAYQVQSLSPSYPLEHTPSEDSLRNETFFLHDRANGAVAFADLFQETIEHHKQAGRARLARALAFLVYS